VTVGIRKFGITVLLSNRIVTEVTIRFEISNIRTALVTDFFPLCMPIFFYTGTSSSSYVHLHSSQIAHIKSHKMQKCLNTTSAFLLTRQRLCRSANSFSFTCCTPSAAMTLVINAASNRQSINKNTELLSGSMCDN